MFIGTAHVARLPLAGDRRAEMVRYLRSHRNPDGGWGLHVEGPSHVFTSVLCYVALRLLDVPADDSALGEARAWFRARGGATASASWGKYFLALLDLYDHAGLHPVPPELWLLPESLPFHPSRLWCHCRVVYLPLSYLWATRRRAPLDARLREIRREIHVEPYDRIDWRAARRRVAAEDAYVRHTRLLRAAHRALALYERRPSRALRRRALWFVLDQIRAEDRNTRYLCIGPVSKLFHVLVWHFERPGGPELRAHVERLEDYLYPAADGLKMQGYNSSELWDTAFACQAAVAAGRAARHLPLLRAAHDYLDRTQVREDVPDRARCYRDRSRGGWPFSTREHGWPISDCTAEAVKAALLLEPFVERPIPRDRLLEAIDLILDSQTAGGGWATYERTRGPAWLEWFNPSDCFADIMIDYPHVECTSACVQALAAFARRHPGARDDRIAAAIERGRRFLLSRQRDDGSWEGAWGICFTYGTWFGVLGLRAAGLPPSHPALRRACDFLRGRQLPDGGWGETAESSRARRYVSTEAGQAVMTSWATLALAHAGERDGEAVRRGAAFLRRRQRPDGSWPPERIAGMFNRTCAIHYDNYLKIFPMWALAAAG
jgi:squalene/oxidosqualene cyclase-like protein